MRNQPSRSDGFASEIKLEVAPRQDTTFLRTLYVQKKNDTFDKRAIDKLEVLTERARHNKALNVLKPTSFKEGLTYKLQIGEESRENQKLLVNKEKKMRRMFEKEHEDASNKVDTLESLTAHSGRVRVRIPNIMFYEPEEGESKDYINRYLDNQKRQFVEFLLEIVNIVKETLKLDSIKSNVRNCVKVDPDGKRLMDYAIIFFDSEAIAKEFILLVDGTEFNRCILKPEILPNRPNF